MATNSAINTANPIAVASGGTGDATLTAYAVLCGGTSSTGPVQSIASVGTSGQVLTSNGAGALPTFQSFTGSLALLQTQDASSSASLDFTTGFSTNYTNYLVTIRNLTAGTAAAQLYMKVTTDGGSNWLGGTGYTSGVNYNALNSTTLTNGNTSAGAQFRLTGTGISTSAPGYGADIWCMNVNTGGVMSIVGQCSFLPNGGTYSYGTIVGYNSGSLTVDGFQFLMSSGNISTGTISVYGLVK